MKRTGALVTTLTVLVVLAAANFLASRHPFRLDLTENRIYTLSGATRKILAGLDDVVTIRVYFTKDLPPALESLRRDVDDMLAEFKGAADQRLSIERIDPGESMMEEQKAAMMGIPPVQLNVIERDKQEVQKVYLGMAVMFGDRQQVIPVVQRLGNLEYELAEAIVKVSSKESPKIVWLASGRFESAEGLGFEIVRELISRRYDVAEVTDKTLADLDAKRFAALVLASPGRLSDDELFALDQYLMGGGRILALVDRFEIGQGLSIKPVETNAADLVMHYGAAIEDSLVLDQSNAMAAFSGGPVTYHMPYPFWPEARRGQFDEKEPIVANLESVVFPWTSPLVLASGEQGAPEALAKTTPYAVAVAGKEAKLDPQSAGEALLAGHREEKVLIALSNGPFRSYFSEKASPPRGQIAAKESAPGARLFVAGSSHWLSDLALRTFPQNAALFENALDSFALGDVLIGIRSRETTSRPIAIMSDGARAAIRYANVLAGPAITVAIGLVLFVVRRARRRAVQLAYIGVYK